MPKKNWGRKDSRVDPWAVVSNEDRADNAQKSVDHHNELTGQPGEELETGVADLLCNLRHLCRREGIDFEQALMTSEMHHDAERDHLQP